MKSAIFVLGLAASLAGAQEPSQPNPPDQDAAPSRSSRTEPIYRVTVVSRTLKAINYHHRSGTTHVGFRGTELMPAARGQAEVESKMGSTTIDTSAEKLDPPSRFGPEFLTYVLWAVTPEGRTQNLGELVPQGGKARLDSTTAFQAFGLIVTAEPYFSVSRPSNVVVMENFVRNDTAGTFEQVDARYELLERGSYTLHLTNYQPVHIDPKGPLQVAEAQNAVEIAKLSGAERYAGDTLQRAELDLHNAQDFVARHKDKEAGTNAREAVQTAEDARLITLRKLQEEETARQQAEAAARQAQARERAEAEAQSRARAEAERETARQQALQAEQRAQQEKANAEEARQQALEQQRASQAQVQQAEAEKAKMRDQLQQQLNAVLQTRETARGLIVNMSDVLFTTGSYTLRPEAKLKLAKIAGIVDSHPGLRLELDGYTDSTGSAEYNDRLSERRADAVREFLTSQGVPQDSVSAKGFGESNPIASNDSAEGRRQNRRVEMVVSGDVIGVHPQPSQQSSVQ